jgi:6-phosphogluconolactonase (cycloisomerase 2 family)
MSINFPTNPSMRDEYTSDDKTFVWIGDRWANKTDAIDPLDIIRAPEITSPTEGSTVSNLTPQISGSTFAAVYFIDTRDYRQFQVDVAAGDFTSPVIDEQANTDSYTVATTLDTDANYKVRIRDVAITGAESPWSEVVSFATPNITVNAPTLTVQGAPSSVEKSPTLTTSSFSTTPAGGDTHAATDWEVRKTSDNSLVYSSLNDSANLTSIKVPVGNLQVSTSYLFRARHVGTTYGAGAYVEVTATTVAQFDIVPLLAVAHRESPYITIYNQEIDTFTKLTNPAALPTNHPTGVAFSGDDTYMAVAHFNSPHVTIYKRSGDTFTKLADPVTLPASSSNGVAFSSDGIYLAVAHGGSPHVTIYKRSGDTFTKLNNPATLPTGTGRSVAFSSDGIYLAVAHDGSPHVTIYKRSGDTFTKLANPATLPTGVGNGVAFSSGGTYLAVAHSTAPQITVYKRSSDSFTKLTIADAAAQNASGVTFSSDATYMVVVGDTPSYITVYKRSGDTFTKITNPATLPPGVAYGVDFSSDDTYLAVVHNTSPFVTIYKRSGDTFTKLTNPATLPTGNGRGVAFSNTGFPQ